MADFDATLIEIVSEHAVGLAEPPTRETPIADLGIDSFAVVEIVYEVEERLGVDVPFNANDNPFGEMATVGDLIDAVKKLSGEAANGAGA
ncbi:MAG: phosphopantetheine-binding protein [Parvularculaceae bacterium]